MKDGSTGTITVKYNNGGAQQATYSLFSANNDAINIAYSTMTVMIGPRDIVRHMH
jgi:hypothetical protein